MKRNEPSSIPVGSTRHRRWTKIEAKLHRAKARLVTVGAIVKKGGSSSPDAWICRFRERVDGRWVNRGSYLGSDEFADRARALIEKWRNEAVSPEDRRRQELLHLWGLTASARGFSGRARQRVRAAALKAFGDWRAELKLTHDIMDDGSRLRRGKSPGRPARSGLW